MWLDRFAVQVGQFRNDFTAFFLKFMQFQPERIIKAVCLLMIANRLIGLLIREEYPVFVFPFCLFEVVVFVTRDIVRNKLRLHIDGCGEICSTETAFFEGKSI